ncbi:MAG: hypothetical protein JSW23_03625 [Planctomycetota bacterium]|nr:MAG: hypothetical protein JSW23_03625 [Planctomycetota bacterium]
MDKNLALKLILIVVLVVVAAWTLYPPDKTLKPGIDLAGGTSLIYEIDTQGLDSEKKRELSSRMITVLRRRIDPANIQNLVWRPQGGTRFEIQMPLASAEARVKRQSFEEARSDLLAENVNPAVIMRSLSKPPEKRTEDFERFARGSAERLAILETLGTAYDERNSLRENSDELFSKLESMEAELTEGGLDVEAVKARVSRWAVLDEESLTEAAQDFLGGEGNVELLTEYVKTYAEWAEAVDGLTDPDTGKNVEYKNARRALDGFNLTEDQVNSCLDMSPKSAKRIRAIEVLKAAFPDREEKIDKVVAAFDEYYPFRGRLDDPKDLQRMLKGAGILEFRILPTRGDPEVDADEMAGYVELLQTKGPKYASDSKYVWCEIEIENISEWKVPNSIVGQFANKYYVLASNKTDEAILHGAETRDWSLKEAQPGTEPRTGRRAIDFQLDDRGGRLFSNVTGKNIDKPLCILLDGIAISAPNIQSRIFTRGQITGNFTKEEVADMVNKLNAGSLPARLIEQPISVKTIGPSIGADNRDAGIKAG